MNKKSNASYVREGFDLIVPALEKYIAAETASIYGADTWSKFLEKLDSRDLPLGGSFEENIQRLDLAACLRLIDRLWAEVFKRRQPIDFRTYAKELMGVRNIISHLGGKDISDDDAWRDLDTMCRMMETVDSNIADRIGDLRRELRYGSKEGSMVAEITESKTKKNDGIIQSLDSELPSWRDIIEPHPDVASGRYQKAEFAADLAQVARHDKRTAIEYSDPVEFFLRTYITEGMKGLLTNALTRISEGKGDPVIQLKTAFGGGKTHSMLALYHLLSGRESLKNMEVLKPVLKEAGLSWLPKANIAVLVGTSLDPASVKRPNDFPGNTVNTIWGEMAMQLARNANKPELYEIVKSADKKHVSPGSEKLKELLDEAGPCLILMDELVAYGKKLYGRDNLPAGSFDNFITFIQELTEAARASEDSMVVASIPESENEIGGEAGQKALEAIEHTFGRMETIWKPVAVNEGFEVVRRRLFKDCRDLEARDRVCEAYSKMYKEEKDHFPYETREFDYLIRLKNCYPIHPEVFDRLFNDWSTLERFQRTRGVLRLMASVIHALWMGGDASSLILPGTLPLDSPSVRDELTRTLPDPGWNSIILSEIDGSKSIPYKIDSEKEYLGKILAARRVARTIFLGSAPSSKHQNVRGMDINQINLGAVQPKESIAKFSDALSSLQKRCTYLNTDQNDDRFWYDLRPTLRKTVNDRIRQVQYSECYELIESLLKKIVGTSSDFGGIHICPRSTADVLDEQKVRLIVLQPEQVWSDKNDSRACVIAEDFLNNRGNLPRQYRNMLLFLAPDERQRTTTINAAKDYLAWKSIENDKDELNLDQKQIREVNNQINKTIDILKSRIEEYYSRLLIPSIQIEENPKKIIWETQHLSNSDQSIAAQAGNRAVESEDVILKMAPLFLQQYLEDFIWNTRKEIQIKELWKYLTTYLYMPRLKNFEVLSTCILHGVQDKNFFGLASGFNGKEYTNLKYAEAITEVYPMDYLVEPETAKDQIIAQKSASRFENSNDDNSGDNVHPISPGASETYTPPAPVEDLRAHHFTMKTSSLDPTRINKQISDIAREILSLLIEDPNTEVNLSFSVDAYSPEGFDNNQQRSIAENCKTLSIDSFELNK